MKYLLLSAHKPTVNKDLALWWAPNSQGYTVQVDKAGKYSKSEAEEICAHGEAMMIPVAEAKKDARLVVIFDDIDFTKRPKRRR